MVVTVSVGICAYNEEKQISGLVESLIDQTVAKGSELKEILVVASGCTDGTEKIVEKWTQIEPRIRLIREPERKGKVSALNLILDQYRGDILVLMNADARLRPKAVEQILVPFLQDERVEIACGRPIPETSKGGPKKLLTEFQWSIHNRTLETLSRLGLDNHCCDEFMAIRRGFVTTLPSDLINDGAYLGVLAALKRRSVRFCPNAEVVVEVQGNLLGVLRYRRRGIWAHRQVESLLDRPSSTFRLVAKRRPQLAAKILAEEFSDRPLSALVFVFLALPLELMANFLAIIDFLRRKPYQAAWPVVE